MTATSAVEKTDRVTVQFADGKELTLPIHGIRLLQFINVLEECGVKSFEELTGSQQNGFLALRCATTVSALALTFPGQETWSAEKIQKTFADVIEITKVFNRCIQLSGFQKAPSHANPAKPGQNPGAYG